MTVGIFLPVVTEGTIVEASSLPSHWSAQQAELYALIQALQLSKSKKTNIYIQVRNFLEDWSQARKLLFHDLCQTAEGKGVGEVRQVEVGGFIRQKSAATAAIYLQ